MKTGARVLLQIVTSIGFTLLFFIILGVSVFGIGFALDTPFGAEGVRGPNEGLMIVLMLLVVFGSPIAGIFAGHRFVKWRMARDGMRSNNSK